MERKLLRQLSKDLSAVSGFGDPQRPAPHPGKDFLGAIVSLTIIGAIVLQVTNALASRCRAEPTSRTGPGTCSGLAAVAHHAQVPVTLTVASCAALAVIAFIWYMFWGYKANGRASRSGGASGL